MSLSFGGLSRTCGVVLLSAVLLFAGPRQAEAWDADVHYGLTKWLAVNAGFTQDDAQTIARANWDVDLDKDKAAIDLMVSQVILGTEAQAKSASARILEYHFPTDGTVGTDPPKRSVSPANPFAMNLIEQARQSKDLRRFGQALHALQDSWSHRGEPDVPIRPLVEIRRPYAWSHPRSRGGWYRHQADITFKNPVDAKVMAASTYTELRRLCEDGAWCRTMPPAEWKAIAGVVEGFVAANTIRGKKKWFREAKVPGNVDVIYTGKDGKRDNALLFVEETSIPHDDFQVDLTPPYARKDEMTAASMGQSVERPATSIGRISTEGGTRPDKWERSNNENCDMSFEMFVTKFLEIWLRPGPLNPNILEEYIDSKEIADQIDAWAREEAERWDVWPEKPRVDNWIRVFLRMWLVRDHGVVEVLYHGFPFGRGYAILEDQLVTRTEPQPSLKLLREVSPDATFGIRSPDRRFDVFQVADAAPAKLNGACGAVFRFKGRLDEDVVILVARQMASSWRFVRLGWLAL